MKSKTNITILLFILFLALLLILISLNTIFKKDQKMENDDVTIYIEEIDAAIKYKNGWKVSNTSNCENYPPNSVERCLIIQKGDFQLLVDVFYNIENLGSGSIITSESFQNSQIFYLSNNSTALRSNYHYSVEERVFIQVIFTDGMLNIGNTPKDGSAYNPVGDKYLSVAYILPSSYMGIQNVNDIPEIQEMDEILKSIKFE